MRYILAIIGSLLLQSVAYGYVSARYPSGNMMQFAFIACILCALFYELSLRIWPVEPHVSEDRRALRRIGIVTALSYVAFFAAMAFIPASVVSLTEIAVGPLFAVFVSAWFVGEQLNHAHATHRRDLWSAAGFFGVMFAATLLVLKAVGVSVDQMIWGVVLSCFAGLGAAIIASIARLHLAHLSPRLVLARHFHLTYVCALVLGLMFEQWIWRWDFWLLSMCVAFFGVVLPMFLLQWGVQKVRPMITMLMLAFVPAMIYVTESVFSGHADGWVSGLITLGVAFAVVYTLMDMRRVQCFL